MQKVIPTTPMGKALYKLGLQGYSRYSNDPIPKQIERYEPRQQMVALLNILHMAGYLSRKKIWQNIHLIGGFEQPADYFAALDPIFKAAGTYQPDPTQFNAGILIDKLFDHQAFTQEDIEDLITFWRQTAFDRAVNQERNELSDKDWMTTHQKAFMRNAQVLGVVHEHVNLEKAYDESWVLGAARLRMTTRLQTLKEVKDQGTKLGTVRLLAGNRELWAEIDGIGDNAEAKQQDGMRYLRALAEKHGIQYNTVKPFITYNESDEPPKGRVKGRTYLNYIEPTTIVTESLMAADVYETVFGEKLRPEELIDTQSTDGHRPNTVSTASNAAASLQQDLARNQKAIKLLVISEQPYLQRQCLAVEREVKNRLASSAETKHVELATFSVGQAASVGVSVINSELGAFSAEQYFNATQGQQRKRHADTLMFRTREKDLSKVPEFKSEIIKVSTVESQQKMTLTL